jgi:hypothetical protein
MHRVSGDLTAALTQFSGLDFGGIEECFDFSWKKATSGQDEHNPIEQSFQSCRRYGLNVGSDGWTIGSDCRGQVPTS